MLNIHFNQKNASIKCSKQHLTSTVFIMSHRFHGFRKKSINDIYLTANHLTQLQKLHSTYILKTTTYNLSTSQTCHLTIPSMEKSIGIFQTSKSKACCMRSKETISSKMARWSVLIETSLGVMSSIYLNAVNMKQSTNACWIIMWLF